MEPRLEDIRIEYKKATLNEADIDSDPLVQLAAWLKDAKDAGVPEHTAFILGTVQDETPYSRVVLLKGLQSGLVFYSNYDSQKGKALADNPNSSACFFWPELERQIRVRGVVEKLPREQSEAYFHSRPRGSQLGAYVSPQSQQIPSRAFLEKAWAEAEAQLEAQPIPMPAQWGGYKLIPTAIEFWQGRPSRLHDRLEYKLRADSTWHIVRLAP